jgi:hypothetical protein
MYLIFLDESGDHSLNKIDPQYPAFVLAGCVMDDKYHDTTANTELNKFKKEIFGSSEIILHTADINRNKNGFESLKSTNFRKYFYTKLNELMQYLDYTVIACVIKKDKHLEKYGLAAIDPYMLSLKCLVERFVFMLRESDQKGLIIAESRNPTLDNQLELAYLNLKISGTHFIKAKEITYWITDLVIKNKSENIAGLQIADLAANPIGRYVLGKNIHEDFRIIEQKLRKRNNKYEGYGLIVLPKE